MFNHFCKRKADARPVALWKSLLVNLVVVMVILVASIMVIMISSTRNLADRLSHTIISRTIDQVENKMEVFFEPALTELNLLSNWIKEGMIDPVCQTETLQLLKTLVEPVDQIATVKLATESDQVTMVRQAEAMVCLEKAASDQRELQTRLRNLHKLEGPNRYHFYQEMAKQSSTLFDNKSGIYWAETQLPVREGYRVFSIFRFCTTQNGLPCVVSFDISFRKMVEYAQNIQVSQNGDLFILSERRDVLAMTRTGFIGRRFIAREPGSIDQQDQDIATIRSAWQNYLTKRSSQDENRPIIRFNSNGKAWWSAVDKFFAGNIKELAILVVVPESDLVVNMDQRRIWILSTVFLVLTAGIIRAIHIARKYSRPIESLVRQSDRISRGDLDTYEPVGSCDIHEIYQLAQAHERMRAGLKTLMRLEGELQLAHQIQQKTIPDQLPHIDGFDLAAWTQPAEKTGGDIYDIFGYEQDEAGNVRLNSGPGAKAMLVLADASGHGIGPALSVTQLRAMIRMAARLTWDIEHIAQHINEQITADLPEGRFITAWLAEIDRQSGCLSWFSAGQAPLFYYHAATADLVQYGADTIPFGILDYLDNIKLHRMEMAPGDLMVVVSDGIFEAFNDQEEQFSLERVRALIARNYDSSAQNLLQTIRYHTEQFMGNTPSRDDQTIIVIKKI